MLSDRSSVTGGKTKSLGEQATCKSPATDLAIYKNNKSEQLTADLEISDIKVIFEDASYGRVCRSLQEIVVPDEVYDSNGYDDPGSVFSLSDRKYYDAIAKKATDLANILPEDSDVLRLVPYVLIGFYDEYDEAMPARYVLNVVTKNGG